VVPSVDCENVSFPNGLNLFGGVHLSTHHEDCNALQKIAKVRADFLRRGTNLSIILHLRPGIFPAQPMHLTNLGGDAVRAWCVISAGFTRLVWRWTVLEALGARYAAGLRSRLDLPIRQMFK